MCGFGFPQILQKGWEGNLQKKLFIFYIFPEVLYIK